jgi:hypothetical protein
MQHLCAGKQGQAAKQNVAAQPTVAPRIAVTATLPLAREKIARSGGVRRAFETNVG